PRGGAAGTRTGRLGPPPAPGGARVPRAGRRYPAGPATRPARKRVWSRTAAPLPAEQRRRDRRHHLGQEHRSVLGVGQAVLAGIGEDSARRGEGDQGYALDEPSRVHGIGLGLGRHLLPRPGGQAAMRCWMCFPTRRALAMAVRAGFTAPMLGKKLVSTTYRLSSSWALQLTSSTEAAGSAPNRQVPAWCAHPARGMLMFI